MLGAMDHGLSNEMVVCLAIVTAVGTAIAVAVGLLPWRQPCTTPELPFLRSSVALRPPLARARAGPIVLQVLRR